MMNDVSVKLYVILMMLAFHSGFSPITWDKKLEKAVIPPLGPWKRVQVAIVFMVAHLYELYVGIMMTLEVFLAPQPRLNEVTLAFAYFMVVLLYMIMLYNIFYQPHTVACSFNSLLFFWENFKDTYLICERDKYIRYLNLSLKLVLVGSLTFPLLVGAYVIENPRDKMFISSQISDPILFSIVVVGDTVAHVLFCFGAASMMSFAFFTSLLPGVIAFFLGKEITPRRHHKQDFCTTSELRRPFRIIHTYRTIFIIQVLTQEFISPIALPMQTTVSYAAILCNFGLIALHQRMNIKAMAISALISVACSAGWFCSLCFAGIAYRHTTRKISKLKSLCDWLQFTSLMEKQCYKKTLKGLIPIKLKVGNFYIIRIDKALSFLSFIFWGTAKVLMLH